MKSNKYFNTICIVFFMCLFFSCGNKHKETNTTNIKKDSLYIDEEMIVEDEYGTYIKGKDFPIDSLDMNMDDLSIPHLKNALEDCFVLSEEEFNTARQIVKDYFQELSVDEDPNSEKPYPYHFYIKQYIGKHDSNTGKDVIEVYFSTGELTHHGWVGELKNNWFGVIHDGGKSVGCIIIDMKQKRVISFSLNGEA